MANQSNTRFTFSGVSFAAFLVTALHLSAVSTHAAAPEASKPKKASKADKASKPLSAQADLLDAKGESIGSVSLSQKSGSKEVKVSVTASKLSPGSHGIHFHETGKCEGPDFKSAGAHLGSEGKEHGLQNPGGPHAGDLPNLTVEKDGTVKAEFTTDRVTLVSGSPSSLLKDEGVAIVIHEKADDQKTSPAGDSGARVACGVIK